MHAGGMMTTKQQQASISSAVSKYFLQITLQINLCNKNYQQILKADEESLSLSLSLSSFLLRGNFEDERDERNFVGCAWICCNEGSKDRQVTLRKKCDGFKGDSTISNSTHFREYSSLMDFGPKITIDRVCGRVSARDNDVEYEIVMVEHEEVLVVKLLVIVKCQDMR
ncbi:unnamed protein product [Sphagnum jensenii]|uniref:Uncharacterized protein n=1 Tax=Sphagnum jensenii TaxID=128206 RepID=A0ABP1A926_9BRYO